MQLKLEFKRNGRTTQLWEHDSDLYEAMSYSGDTLLTNTGTVDYNEAFQNFQWQLDLYHGINYHPSMQKGNR